MTINPNKISPCRGLSTQSYPGVGQRLTRLCFEKMLGYANQAFTHLALISAAYHLDRQLRRMI